MLIYETGQREFGTRIRQIGPLPLTSPRRWQFETPMRILFLAQRVPFPPDRGDKIATYHYVRHLARKHDVQSPASRTARPILDNVAGLAPMVRSVDAVVCSPMRRTSARWRP